MISWRWLVLLGLPATPFVACGPDHRPEHPCEGPSFNLVVRAEMGPLPPDTRINIRYGGNPEGEPYELGNPRTPQAVSCTEDLTQGGAASEAPAVVGGAGAGGGAIAKPTSDERVWALRCGLYTQGPARVDVTAMGFETVDDQALSFDDRRHCEVEREITLVPEKPDAGGD